MEVSILIDSYNSMIDDLEESAIKLAKSERETAWREMAKQVAHEIKNPLTPMRLTIQSFEKNFNPEDTKNRNKIRDFSKSLIEQIDTMSSIATAFSDFANMPEQKRELLNVVEVVQIGGWDVIWTKEQQFFSGKPSLKHKEVLNNGLFMARLTVK